ncbi:MAG TPA: chorismate synthase [Gemmatimonadaceae bacterium]|jgi:chorismate synthase|nr:chorismate synthase [Gemmatimonadaceae bacterium]
MLRITTAGESHGPALVSILEGMVAGLPLLAADVDVELARRQQGYGRGRRMKIESDHIEFLSGVRAGQTLGSPIAMTIQNRDWKNWQEIMDPAPREGDSDRKRVVTRPRPGHVDLSGMLKYDRDDARDVLERASARETTARVAAGAICRKFLREFDITIGSHIIHLGGVDAKRPAKLPGDLNAAADQSQLRTLDADAEKEMITRIDAAKAEGNTLGGIAEIICDGVPVGLGSHISWSRKLDGRLAAALMSIPAVKAVEIGLGVEAAKRKGSDVHDEIDPDEKNVKAGRVRRRTNRAGGLEGGITNGEQIVLHVSMKPISTLMRPLGTVEMKTREPAQAVAERSDVTAVPAMGVIAEAMTAFIVAQAFLEKFGGDSLAETRRNYSGYIAALSDRKGR